MVGILQAGTSGAGLFSSLSGGQTNSATSVQATKIAQQTLQKAKDQGVSESVARSLDEATMGQIAAGSLTSARNGAAGSSSSLLNQIQQTAAQRFVDKKAVIDQTAQSKTDFINGQNDRYINVLSEINSAKASVSVAEDHIASVDSLLLDMRVTVGQFEDTTNDTKLLRAQFDNQVTAINNEADSDVSASNLVGSVSQSDFSPNQVEYKNGVGTGVSTLNGTYIGGGYSIKANDGTVWVPDLGSDLIQAYSQDQGSKLKTTYSDGSTGDKATSTRTGITLVSYNKNTNAITVNITIDPEQPPLTVTGTLQRAGTKVMQSWFYNGLATKADRDRARADITTADAELASSRATIAGASSQVQSDDNRVKGLLDQLSSESAGVLREQLEATDKLKGEMVQQLAGMQVNLDNLSQQQQNYLNAFGGFVKSPLARFSLFNFNT